MCEYKSRRALVVDDDNDIRFMVTKILQREGFRVDGVRDGFEAIGKLKDEDYDLVLLDLMMPRIDGFGVIRFLQKEKPLVLGKVIVMSALNPTGVEDQIDRVLSKPFDVTRLIDYAREESRDNAAQSNGNSNGRMGA